MIRWIRNRWGRLRDQWRRWFPDLRHIHLDPEYQTAHIFKDEFEPKKGADYKWVVDYARQVYDRLDRADQSLETKAESIIKALGGGTGLLTLGAIANLANLANLNVPTATCLIIALLLALVAILIAAWVRVPRDSYMPPSIGWALAYVETYG